jgi:hypothetical protein
MSSIKRVLNIFSIMREGTGSRLATYLSKPQSGYRTFSPLTKAQWLANLQAGGLILVEGNSRWI